MAILMVKYKSNTMFKGGFLVGFGTFTTVERAAREGKNPTTGKKIQIAASTQPKIKAGKELKDALNA